MELLLLQLSITFRSRRRRPYSGPTSTTASSRLVSLLIISLYLSLPNKIISIHLSLPNLSEVSKVHAKHEGVGVPRLPAKSEHLPEKIILDILFQNCFRKGKNEDLVKPGHDVPTPFWTILCSKLMR